MIRCSCVRSCARSCVRLRVCYPRFIQFALGSCAHKRIVNIMKLYIERNNIQVELIRFRKQISTLFTFTFERREGSRIALCLQPIR